MTSDRGYTLLKVASDTDCSRTLIMEVPNKIKKKNIFLYQTESDSGKVFMDTEAPLIPCAEPHHEITIHVPPTRERV